MSLANVDDSYNSDEDDDYVLPADAPENVNEDLLINKEDKKPEDEKKAASDPDALWADFLKEDTPSTSEVKPEEKSDEKKVVQVFDFAGEIVEVEKEAPASGQGVKRKTMAKSGLDSALSALKKPKKMSVLDKSSHDWNKFVKTADLADELEKHQKSKDSFLDKQRFISAVDSNRFEREKETRDRNRKAL